MIRIVERGSQEAAPSHDPSMSWLGTVGATANVSSCWSPSLAWFRCPEQAQGRALARDDKMWAGPSLTIPPSLPLRVRTQKGSTEAECRLDERP
jgi:hypothetical protein